MSKRAMKPKVGAPQHKRRRVAVTVPAAPGDGSQPHGAEENGPRDANEARSVRADAFRETMMELHKKWIVETLREGSNEQVDEALSTFHEDFVKYFEEQDYKVWEYEHAIRETIPIETPFKWNSPYLQTMGPADVVMSDPDIYDWVICRGQLVILMVKNDVWPDE